jgi:hypothetical protein
MAIPEACELWIEQRVQEELEQKKDTGASLREIGRVVAAEVEKYFETKVNPGTILTKAARMNKAVSNETKAEKPTAPIDSEEIKQIKRQPAKDGTMRGGPRPGAGRKMNPQPEDGQPARKEDLEKTQNQCTEAYQFETIAISQLRRIRKDDPDRVGALIRVKKWIESQLSKG